MDAPVCQGCLERDRRIAELEARVAALERAAKRQAAPFSKGKPKRKPRKPGRKRGQEHGKHGHREPPSPDQIDETHEASLPEQCPDCGGKVVEDRLDEQYQTEIPRKPIVRKFNIHCGHCEDCGKRLRGRHRLQTSGATGVAQSQVGSDAQAAIVYLNKHGGMSCGKIADMFEKLHGIKITRGACAQIVCRAGRKLQGVHQEIKERIKTSEYLTPDETGWRVGGRSAWLHAWVGDEGATLYAIDPQRSADVLQRAIGIDWSGSMTHDGLSSYDRFFDAAHQQCVDHALRRARRLVEKNAGSARLFPAQVIRLYGKALRLRDRLNQANAGLDRRARAYDDYTQRLFDLTKRPRPNQANEKFAQHLCKHAASWFLFLVDPRIPATNHLAEQALKTPIVNRKVWGGNRTNAGAQAQAVLCSVQQTCRNKGLNPFTFVSDALRGSPASLFT